MPPFFVFVAILLHNYMNRPPTIRRPYNMPSKAANYWTKHAQRLSLAGTLTEENSESFALLCRCWAMLCELDDKTRVQDFNTLTNQYTKLCKLFGIMPDTSKKPQARVKDEYGL